MLSTFRRRQAARPTEPVLIDGRWRSHVTLPGYRLGVSPLNKGLRFPAEIYTNDEVMRMLAACGRGAAGDRDRAIIVVMWRAGLRVDETLSLMPKDVDVESGTVTVLHGKGDRSRTVGLDPQACAMVAVWAARRRDRGLTGRQPLFCVFSGETKGKKMYSSCVREKLKLVGARAGIEKRMHPHGLRHTCAYNLSMAGVPLNVVQKVLGHSELATTARYIDHIAPRQVIDTMRALTWEHEPTSVAA